MAVTVPTYFVCADRVQRHAAGKRQTAIEHLTHYRLQDVEISLCRDKSNAADKKGRRRYCRCTRQRSLTMGYLPRAFAAFIAPLMDSGKRIGSRLASICGGQAFYLSYGMRIEVRV